MNRACFNGSCFIRFPLHHTHTPHRRFAKQLLSGFIKVYTESQGIDTKPMSEASFAEYKRMIVQPAPVWEKLEELINLHTQGQLPHSKPLTGQVV